MGFVINGREIQVTSDGLIHLVDLVMVALGVDRVGAAEEIKHLVKEGGLPEVRCFKRGEDVLVTSGGAEGVLARLSNLRNGVKGGVLAGMRCFMSQNGPFATRIRDGTVAVPVAEMYAEKEACQWAEEPPCTNSEWSSRLLRDTEWARVVEAVHHDVPAEPVPEPKPEEPPATSNAPELEMKQVDSVVRLSLREHYSDVVTWYREVCADAELDDRAKGVFKAFLLDICVVPRR
jgi:hypothetical protein